MPYRIRKSGRRWAVVNKETGEVRGHTNTHAEAQRFMAALYVHAGDDKKSGVLIHAGQAVKALGGGRVGGYLVIFSGESDPDLSGDFFTPDTDFGFEGDETKSAVLYDHGMETTIGPRKIGSGTIVKKDAGLWIEAQLKLRDEYEKAIYKLAEAGKLGWSSGTASHLVRKEPVKGAFRINLWPIGLDASLTPRPCEPRTSAVSLKSLSVLPAPIKLLDESNDQGPASVEDRSAMGPLLGDVDEVMTLAALRQLHDMFCMRLCGIIAADDDLDTEVELLDHIAALLDEYRECCLSVVAVLMPEDDEDGDGYAEIKAEAREMIQKYGVASYKGLRLSDHLESVHAAARGLVDRMDAVARRRADEGRAISRDRLSGIKSLAKLLDGLHERAGRILSDRDRDHQMDGNEHASREAVSRLQAELAYFEASLLEDGMLG